MNRANSVPICDYEGSPWRTAFWPGREYEDRAERIALAKLLPPTGKRLIEIGAGFGRLAELYRGYEQVVLLDYSRSLLQEARQRLAHDPRFIFVAADLYNMPLADNAFDTAVTVRVLHHVVDVPRAFGEISRITHPHGAYVTDFANKRHLKAMVKYWLGQGDGDSPFTLAPYEFVKLNFDYHPRYIRQNLEHMAFAIRDERAVSTFRVPLLKRLVPPDVLAQADGVLQRPMSNVQIAPSIFLRAESLKPGDAEINPALWRCPNCGGTQIETLPDALVCRACGTLTPCVDGIYDFKGMN